MVVERPIARRRAPRASVGLRPAVKTTAYGVSFPSWHADPGEATMSGAVPRLALSEALGNQAFLDAGNDLGLAASTAQGIRLRSSD